MTPEQEEQYLEDQVKQGKSTVRWMTLGLAFIIMAVFFELVAFIMFFGGHKEWFTTFLASMGLFGIGQYCKWVASTLRPESWRD